MVIPYIFRYLNIVLMIFKNHFYLKSKIIYFNYQTFSVGGISVLVLRFVLTDQFATYSTVHCFTQKGFLR